MAGQVVRGPTRKDSESPVVSCCDGARQAAYVTRWTGRDWCGMEWQVLPGVKRYGKESNGSARIGR